MDPTAHPAREYRRRADASRLVVSERERLSHLIGNLRLLIFVIGVACAWAALSHSHLIPLWTLLVPIAAFAALLVWHDYVLEQQRCAEKAASFYDRGISRIEDRWIGTGSTGERFRETDHVFADDLDLFGRGSLFELLSGARTPMGEATLAHWLLVPISVGGVRDRQHAIRELAPRIDFREDLAVLGGDVRVPKETDHLLTWAEAAPVPVSMLIRATAFALMLAAIATTVVGFANGLWSPLVLVIAVEGVIAWRWRGRIEQIVEPVSGAAADLALASVLVGRTERERFDSARLRAIAAGLENTGDPPSRAMARLKTLVNWADSRHNMLVRFLDVPLMYSLQVTFAVEAWRRVHGRSVRRWLEAFGEIEALSSLAAYCYEHPNDPFPELAEREAPFFAGEELGHPLLPSKSCVRNSVALEGTTSSPTNAAGKDEAFAQVFLVSGSNMSGKSTFLRTIGINAVLAMAGAPVRARCLRLTRLRIGAAIRVTDSLQQGRSGFYAEITRLRQIMDLASTDRFVLFLADELLHGTNSHDRRIGAEGLIRALLDRGAIGLVTTHDLALTSLVDPRIRNAHFQDELRDGRMVFDYKLQEGVVTKSNALELMRSVGLDV